MKRSILGFGIGVGAILLATTTSAFAQQPDGQTTTPPPTGPVDTLPPKTNPPPTNGTAGAGGSVSVGSSGVAGSGGARVDDTKKDDGITDHEKVVGKFGIGYFGVTAQPIGTGGPAAVGRGTVNTPVIGMRYWLQERLGIDVGLGFNFFSSSRAVVQGGQAEVSTDGPAVLAFALHGGLPLAFAYGKHYKFLVVPELNFGYATQTEAAQNVPAGAQTPPDIHRTGIRFDIGARVGTEIQFGFIGIPELALQASVGLNFRRQVWHASQDAGGTVTNPSSSSDGQNNFGTTVQADPWALFVNNIAAIYYFP